MTKVFVVFLLCLLTALPGWATDPIYINNSPLTVADLPPQIDATRFVNRSSFDVATGFIFIGGGFFFLGTSLQPYETLNTAFFTNTAGASMSGSPGFRFTFFTNNTRLGMEWWVNQGVVGGDALLLIDATNILNRGDLSVGETGLLRLRGGTVDLRRSTMLAGLGPNAPPPFGGDTFGTNFSNASGVSTIYWGFGLNNRITNDAPPVLLAPFTNFGATVVSPLHQVVQLAGNGFFTNLTSIGGMGFAPFVFTNTLGPMNYQVQVVFVPTNSNPDTNFVMDVRFVPGLSPNGGADVIVAFESIDLDIFSGGLVTNGVYLVDHSAFTTNITETWLTGTGINRPRRPSTYEFFRIKPFEWDLPISVPGTNLFSGDMLYNESFASNEVNMGYAAYAASFASPAATNNIIIGGTNLPPPGRIEVFGDVVNLDRARIKAETILRIEAENLTSNRVATVDAPFLNYDFTSLEPALVIQNLAPLTVRRFSGQIFAWSGVWQNTITNDMGDITVDFHVLIVQPFVQTIVPVTITDLSLASENLVITDFLTATRSVKIDAPSLTILGGLTFPFDSTYHWAPTNVMNLLNFTNSGSVNISGAAFFGTDPSGFDLNPVPPLENYVITSSGSISAASQIIRADNVEVSGIVEANIGLISIEANSMTLSGGALGSLSDIHIVANTLAATNSIIIADFFRDGGLLTMNISDSLVDGGPSGMNNWLNSDGMHMLTLPAVSDLLGTYIASITDAFGEANYLWPANDLGASPAGFVNNLAVGRLILDGGAETLFTFASATGEQAAMYVAFLELLGSATDPASIEIAENFTVYFADSNVDPTTIHPRFVRVDGFVPPAPAPVPSTAPKTINAALQESVTLDSDGDGVVNVFDTTPFFTSDQIELHVAFGSGPSKQTVLSWTAPPNSISTIEYKDSLQESVWRPKPPVANGASSAERLSIVDTLSDNLSQQRFYRVRVRQR
ncbi:MAG: hypothetical protein L0Y58_24200 [Verrucomicrobia subdivision 3 bacterium]|nr:hypothetical protein [Limisphaerales bacterium]